MSLDKFKVSDFLDAIERGQKHILSLKRHMNI